MQITLTKSKQLILASLMVCGGFGVANARDGVAVPSGTVGSPAQFRELYQDSVIPVKYILVDEKSQECCNGSRPNKVYVLDSTRDAPPRKIFSSEISELAGAHFEVEVDHESLIETPIADFLVLKLTRPVEYSKKAKPCAAGMGEQRHYLARIEKNAIRFIDRSLLGCGDTLSVLKGKNMVGYEVTVNHAGEDKSHLVRYVYRDGQMITQTSALPSADRK